LMGGSFSFLFGFFHEIIVVVLLILTFARSIVG
jgi:hypothetical protein